MQSQRGVSEIVKLKDKIEYMLERNDTLPADQKLSLNAIARQLECSVTHVANVNKKFKKRKAIEKNPNYMEKVKTEADVTLAVMKDSMEKYVKIRNKLEKLIANATRGEEVNSREVKTLVDALATMSKEIRLGYSFLHELRGDLNNQKQGNLIIYYTNAFDGLRKKLEVFMDELPIDWKMKLYRILDDTHGAMISPPKEITPSAPPTVVDIKEVIEAEYTEQTEQTEKPEEERKEEEKKDD